MHERQMHDLAVFVTLTYDDENLPQDGSLDYEHWQLFMKRLRKAHEPAKLRFYHCGEYGETTRRPHYHAILFGIDFPDKKEIKKSGVETLYQSETLDKIWGKGHCWIGNVTFDSCAYVSRYVTKKVTGDQAASHYTVTNPETGEIYQLKPEYSTMSRRPGIGASWYALFKIDVFPSDEAVVRGRITKPPKYYLKLLAQQDPKAERKIIHKRMRAGKSPSNLANSTPERLAVRETVRKAKIQSLRRNLE